jgi:hypothetical protein
MVRQLQRATPQLASASMLPDEQRLVVALLPARR